METGSRMVVARAGGRGDRVLNGNRVSVLQDEKSPETHGGDGCAAAWMCLMPLNCTLKHVDVLNFLCILPQKKKLIKPNRSDHSGAGRVGAGASSCGFRRSFHRS